jgi:hypothetical protein
MQLIAPSSALQGGRVGRDKARLLISGVGSALLLALAMVAMTADSNPGRTALSEEVDITKDDVDHAIQQVHDILGNLPTETAGHLTGSVPTDEEEAAAIMGPNGPEMERNMGKAFADIDVHHAKDTDVADAIIDSANADNMDVTGEAGELTYNDAVKNTEHAELLRGSLPTYRAESNYITSGIAGNYEKALEDAPTAEVMGGKVKARIVAAKIIDAATAAAPGQDCTGVVSADGQHGIGLGVPGCPDQIGFKKEADESIEEAEAATGGEGEGEAAGSGAEPK